MEMFSEDCTTWQLLDFTLMPEVLSQNCGFCGKNAYLTNCELRLELKKIEESLMDKLKSENVPVINSCTANLKANQELKAQMEATRSANLKANQELKAQMEEIRSANLKVNQELKAQMEETIAAKTENFENLIKLKHGEIEKIRRELEDSQLQNEEKKVQIYVLKLKIDILKKNSGLNFN
jgi:hypothetical protein